MQTLYGCKPLPQQSNDASNFCSAQIKTSKLCKNSTNLSLVFLIFCFKPNVNSITTKIHSNYKYNRDSIAEEVRFQKMTGFSTSHSLAYAGFSKGGPGNLRIMKTKRKRSLLRFSPFSCPKLGEDRKQKNKVSLRLSSVFESKLHDDQKKGLPQIFVLKLSAQVTKGEAMPQFGILFYAN